jgi:CRISPR system Cascade subunit CasE
MNNQPVMIASVLSLSRADAKDLKMIDDYSVHRVVYDLFSDERSEVDKKSKSSGFLYIDKGWDKDSHKILMLSNRKPNEPKQGELSKFIEITDSFLSHLHYRFEVVVNPTKCDGKLRNHPSKESKTIKGKTIPLKTREEIASWFDSKAPQWGFSVKPEYLEVRDIEVKRFKKGENEITLAQAKIVGGLTVTDKEKFVQSFQNGIGRGRAFGCGLLQIVPI